MKRLAIATGFIAGFVFALLPVLFPSATEAFAGAALVIVSMFLLLGAPAIRLRRLGAYLRQTGLDQISDRGSFRTRDDHFFLDLSIGRWFQHPSFAIAYVGILVMYLLGWSLMGTVFLLSSLPLIGIVLFGSRRLAAHLLSPFSPRDVAIRIEATYPPKSKGIANPIVNVTLLYLIGIGYFASNEIMIILLTALYAALLLYLGFVSRQSRKSAEATKPKD